MTSLLCDGCVFDQTGQPYSLWEGLNKSHRQQLLDFSQSDREIVANTGDATRFGTVAKMNKWLAGSRIFYLLTPKENANEMSGLIWFSLEPLSIKTTNSQANKAQWTFAVRLYKSARGRHLSKPYMKKSFKHFWQKHASEPVWLSTKSTNFVAQKIYTNFGFKLIGEKNGRLFYIIYP